MRPGPLSVNSIGTLAVGTTRPCPSTAATVTTATSSPSAWSSARSGVRRMAAGSPVVSTRVSATTLPSRKARAASAPGAYLTFHFTSEKGAIF